jgi:hypothetical protein
VHSTWVSEARQQILIILKPKGSKFWFWITRPMTNSKGEFRSKFVDPVSATWSAEYLGNRTHMAAAAAEYYVPVHGTPHWLAPRLARLHQLATGPFGLLRSLQLDRELPGE